MPSKLPKPSTFRILMLDISHFLGMERARELEQETLADRKAICG
jgi:hypothetical protein